MKIKIHLISQVNENEVLNKTLIIDNTDKATLKALVAQACASYSELLKELLFKEIGN